MPARLLCALTIKLELGGTFYVRDRCVGGGGGTERRKRAERNFRAPLNFKREDGCIIKMFDHRWCESFYRLFREVSRNKFS